MMPGMMTDGTMVSSGEAGIDAGLVPGQKGIIECKECVLIPPSPSAPPPVTRERPLGCKTVYIGGIPENCTENIIKDVFGRCGEMQTIRLSKKNFCHIRFVYEASVDAAIFLSGDYQSRRNHFSKGTQKFIFNSKLFRISNENRKQLRSGQHRQTPRGLRTGTR